MPKQKILILRFSSIGDIVLTTPIIRALKTQLEDAEVHFCTKSKFSSILEANPYIDKIHLLEDDLGALIQQLKAEKFDHIIDLHNNLRTKIIKLRLSKPNESFDKLNWEKWLIVNFKINKLPNVHIVDRYYDTAIPLGIKKDNLGPDYFIPEKDEVEKDWLPETHRNGYVAFAIGGQLNTKKLPVDRIIELCDKINKPIIVLGGKEDADIGERLEDFSNRKHDTEEMKISRRIHLQKQ